MKKIPLSKEEVQEICICIYGNDFDKMINSYEKAIDDAILKEDLDQFQFLSIDLAIVHKTKEELGQ